MVMLSLIEAAVDSYRSLDAISGEIEAAVQIGDYGALPSLLLLWQQLQDETKKNDQEVIAGISGAPVIGADAAVHEWLWLMKRIQERNQQMVPRIRSIMELQRDELRTLRQGNAVLHSYRPAAAQTGRHLSSAG